MGKSYHEKQQNTLKLLKKSIPATLSHIDLYDFMEISRLAIETYITQGKVNQCKCGRTISLRSKSGTCRVCYMEKYRKKDQYKRLDALRAKAYRKRQKVKAIKQIYESR